ncbi:MAG: LTA synthase family protein [Bacteroidota bacterium]|nr:LTA synthase family protein [Bacteroidota bacterium]
MPFEKKLFQQSFSRIAAAMLITICLVRVYEYVVIASRLFVEHPFKFELAGLFYDLWLWLIYSVVLLFFFWCFWLIHRRLASLFFHFVNVIFLLCYIALLITFSQRTTPFDHEFFTRNGADTMLTIKQMLTTGWIVFLPFAIYLLLYFVIYFALTKRINFSKWVMIGAGVLALFSIVFINNSNPNPDWFSQTSAYYLTSNKMSYWLHDSYHYFIHNKEQPLTDTELLKEVEFYQAAHPFQYTSIEYPLLHKNNSADVLGPFFNLKDSVPNIVILVVEGLSKDFSGDDAYAGSFTPFLDSLSKHSLVWDNFLSTAPGTFAAQPAITASVPYGKKGFSIMNVMPDHLSLIKLVKRNGYYTNFMIGFNPDFDNMGGYIRLQGTDFILSHYGPQYKKMGVGDEGWSMGYPDDALFSRSFEVLDSVRQTPYLNIYHTGTTHMPYLFEQRPLYEKLFDQKIKTMSVTPSIKRTLRDSKSVITTFMFSDDCLKKFFAVYAKRPEYSNTIFFITGDHHIGSFPITGEIDDFHVPFIVYSPMLKKAHRFYSVNSHNNIAPTITALLQDNYKLQWQPANVHWLADVIDTATQFRNTQSMAFMSWSRDIKDYIYKDYFLSANQLYKLQPHLLLQPYKNDSLKKIMIRLRENFKNINSYVCNNNKVYPAEEIRLPGQKKLLWEYSDTIAKRLYLNAPDTSLAPDFVVPKGNKYLYVEMTADVTLPPAIDDETPALRFALIDTRNNKRQYLYWSKHDMTALSKSNFIANQWNTISANDMFTLDDYKKINELKFEVAVYTDFRPINLQMRRLQIKVYGIEEK